MADGGVFRRFIEIVLDKASAAKAQRDTQAALNNATNPKGAVLNLDGVGRAVSNVTRLFAQAGAAVVGYALALTRMTERGGQVLNVQVAFTRAVGDADAALTQLRKATNGLISDYDLMVGFNKALSLGAVETVEQFGEMASVARDLGRALGVDASYAMEQLSLGIARHSVKILDNIGITAKATDDFATIMEKAREGVDKFGVSGGNTADMLKRVTVQFGNLRDEVGKFLAQDKTLRIAFFEFGNVLETLLLSLQSGDIEIVKKAFKGLGTILGMAFADAFATAVGSVLQDLEKRHPILDSALGLAGGFAAGAATGGLVGAGFAGVGAFPGALVGGVVGGVIGSNTGVSKLTGAVSDQIAADSAARAEAINAEIAALAALHGELVASQKRNGLLNPPGAGTVGTGPAGLPTFDTSNKNIFTRDPGRELEDLNNGVQFPDAIALEDRTQDFLDLVDQYRSGFSQIESAGTTAALGIQSAFQDAFSALGDEGNAFGNFFEALFRGTAASALTAIAQLATSKVVENIAYAFEDYAKASAAAAMGNPFTAALFTMAAKGHLVAAAKWGVVGGVAGAAAAAVSGGGGGGGSFSGSDVVGRQIDKLDASQGVVNVYIDGVDPTNPRHQRLLWDTVARGQQRAGPNARVNILPRGNP